MCEMALMLSVVRAPSATVVASITTTTKATIVTVAARLMASSPLVTESAKSSILVALGTLQVAWIAAEALLVRLLRQTTLSNLTRSVVRCRSWSARLGPERGWAGPATLGVTEGFQRVLIAALLACLLLSVRRVLVWITPLRSRKHIRKTAKSTGTSCSSMLALRSC